LRSLVFSTASVYDAVYCLSGMKKETIEKRERGREGKGEIEREIVARIKASVKSRIITAAEGTDSVPVQNENVGMKATRASVEISNGILGTCF